jgi:benzoylformate decarboxylase
VAGMDLVREYIYYGPEPAIPRHLRLVHFDESPREIGKNYPVEVGVLGDVKSGLAELEPLLSAAMNDQARAQAAARRESFAKAHAAEREQLVAAIDKKRDQRPMPARVMMESIARVLPENVAVVEEAVTSTNTTFHRLGALKNTSGYFAHRGWALGWGLGCSLGVKLAWPERPVLAMLGEGAAMYGIQGLWSAAHHKLGVTFVICNNAQYQILKSGAAGLNLPAAKQGQFVGMDLSGPEVDMVGLARSLGVAAERVTEPDELTEKVRASLASGEPHLFDVPIARSLAGPA